MMHDGMLQHGTRSIGRAQQLTLLVAVKMRKVKTTRIWTQRPAFFLSPFLVNTTAPTIATRITAVGPTILVMHASR